MGGDWMNTDEQTLRAMADLYPHWRDACLAGADAINIVEEYMHTPCFRPDEPTQAEHDTYARMRELVCRNQKP